MANRNPKGNDGEKNDWGANNFERNKYRQTMPSRFNPISPQDPRNHRYQNNGNSPTQSHVSNATNYEQPWTSPKFQVPAPPSGDEPRFRRTHSMAAKKFEKNGGGASKEEEKSRPKINFMEFGKKITNKFKGNSKNSKNKTPSNTNNRMSAPTLKLGDSSTSSQPQIPSTSSTSTTSSTSESPSPTKKKKTSQVVPLKMSTEDRMKMFQKMGRQQAMKETSLQRMQRERQRDFSLIPSKEAPGRASLAASNQSIDSMLVFNTTPDSRRSTSLSMTDDDVEPVFKNSLTNKPMTSAQFKNQQKLSSGPSFTSTPRLIGSGSFQRDSPTISNVRSISEASFCMVTSEETNIQNRTDSTMYFSADTLNSGMNHSMNPSGMMNPGGMFPMPPMPYGGIPFQSMTDVSLASTASTPTSAPTSSEPPAQGLKRVKQEVVENDQRSDCPSFSSSTPASDLEGNLNQNQQNNMKNSQPEHLSNLWLVSKDIRDKQLQLERSIPLMDSLRQRAMAIDQQKMILFDKKGDEPSLEDMRLLWKLDREYAKLNQEMGMASVAIQDAHNVLPFLEMRRNELLAASPPPPTSSNPSQPSINNFQTGSLV